MTFRLRRGTLNALDAREHDQDRRNLRHWASALAGRAAWQSNSCGFSTVDLAPDFDEFCAFWSAHRVEFVVIGGIRACRMTPTPTEDRVR
ncbi:MAG: hypothetical protein ABIS06_10355 [Vicinamibacterales bacterium]